MRKVGRDAAVVRVTSGARHAPAWLMGALRSLELQVQHACVSRVHGVTTQDVLVNLPDGAAALQDHDGLRGALLQKDSMFLFVLSRVLALFYFCVSIA